MLRMSIKNLAFLLYSDIQNRILQVDSIWIFGNNAIFSLVGIFFERSVECNIKV